MVWLYWSYSVWISSRLHELFYCVVQFYNDEEHWTVVLSNSGASVNRSASIPVRRVQQGVHTALLVGVALSQGSRSRIPVRAQATPRQSLRVWGVWSHDWASRATLRSPQTSTSVQSGAASSPRQALLQVHWTINVRRRVAVPTTLARPAVSVSTAGEYLIYCSLDRPVVIIRVRFCRTVSALYAFHSARPSRTCFLTIYSATSNNMQLVHWLLMGGLLHLVQRGGDWVGPQPAQAPPWCTECNSPPVNGQCTNHRIAV